MQTNSGWSMGRLRIHDIQTVRVIEVHGEVDIAAAVQLEPQLDAATDTEPRIVVIDLTPVEFFDCYSLRLLCRVESRVTERGGQFLLVCPQPLILRMLRVSGLRARFAPLPTLEEALAMCGERSV